MAALLAMTAASGASNMISSLGSTGLQASTSLQLQKNEQDYNTGIMNRVEKTFTDVGLPKFQAYTGNSGNLHLPGQQFHVTGSNFYSAGLVGQSVPFLSTPYQAYTHTGRPGPVNKTSTATQTGGPGIGSMTRSTGTDDSDNPRPDGRRAGLGLYSQVRPWNEPQNVNELGDTTYRNLPINRNFMNNLTMAQNQEMNSGMNMQTIPKTVFTRTSFPSATPLHNFVSPSAVDLHRQAASMLQ